MSLAPELAREICAEGYAAGYRHLHLTGGEPLLWEGLSDLLDEVFSLGYRSVFLNSNGMLMTEHVARRLAQYPNLALSVSLQGPEVLHDGMRGTGSHRQVRRGIARALDAGLKLTIFTAIGNTLLAQLPAFAADVYEKFDGIERLTLIQMIRVKGDDCGLSRELLSPEDFIRLVRTVSALNLYGLKIDVLNDPLVNVALPRCLHYPW
jgi:MoaA/NifB/PqqE/SkfB family radical SAM enzyme